MRCFIPFVHVIIYRMPFVHLWRITMPTSMTWRMKCKEPQTQQRTFALTSRTSGTSESHHTLLQLNGCDTVITDVWLLMLTQDVKSVKQDCWLRVSTCSPADMPSIETVSPRRQVYVSSETNSLLDMSFEWPWQVRLLLHDSEKDELDRLVRTLASSGSGGTTPGAEAGDLATRATWNESKVCKVTC